MATNRKYILLLIVVLIGAAPGCGDAVRNTVEKAVETSVEMSAKENGQEVEVDLENGTMRVVSGEDGETVMEVSEDAMTVTSEEGNVEVSFGDAAKIPDDFPSDVPVYKDLVLQIVQRQTESDGFVLNGKTSDSVEQVSEYYATELPKEGWTRQSAMDQAEGRLKVWVFNKENRVLNLMMVGEGDGDTVVQLTTLTE